MTRRALVCLALLLGACGGISQSDGPANSGGSAGLGGSDGGGAGGNGGSVGGSGGSVAGSGGVSGQDAGPDATGGCGGGMGGTDCNDPCTGGFYSPSCENGVWDCYPQPGCNPGGCPADQVMTPSGCTLCDDAKQSVLAAVEGARSAHDACTTAADCIFEPKGICVGICPQAVSATEDNAYLLDLQKVFGDWCTTGLLGACGYTDPSCPSASLACNAGHCEAN